MLHKVLYLLAFIAMGSSAQAQQPFTIEGKLAKLKRPAKIMFYHRVDDQFTGDSAMTVKGAFSFKGKTDAPQKVSLVVKFPAEGSGMEGRAEPDYLQFYIDGGQVRVSGDSTIRHAVVTKGKTQAEYDTLQGQLKSLTEKLKPLDDLSTKYYYEKKEAAQKELTPRIEEIRKQMSAVEDKFIETHPDSWVSLDLVGDKAVIIDPPVFEPVFNALSQRVKDSKAGQRMAAALAIAKKFDIGRPAMNFTQNNTQDVPVSLASLKGKYVLIDFWASWCGPCRAENPHVLRAYQQFKDRNFEIIGVSLDNNKDGWLKAIKDDSLPWVHLSDLKGWKNEVAASYGVQAIPQNFLLDPEGVIIGKNMRGEVLYQTLQTIFGTTAPKDSAVVRVKLKNTHDYHMYFAYNKGDAWGWDSTYVLDNGYKVYTLPVSTSAMIPLVIRNQDMVQVKDGFMPGPMNTFLLKEGATLTVEGDADDPMGLTVTSDNADIRDYELYRSAYQVKAKEKWTLIKKLYQDQDTVKAALTAKIGEVDAAINALQKEFVNKYRGRYAAMEVFSNYYTKLDNKEATGVFNTFPDSVKNTEVGIRIGTTLENVSRSSSGNMVIPFAQKDIHGKTVDLAALKGKVVLIDFWGSWCGSCRQGHPHLKEVYKKYKKKGLEIVGVALENGDKARQEKAWKDAVMHDGINWLQVLNGPGESDLVKLYGVTVLPTKVLVDRKGNIVLRDVGESAEALDEKLNELLP